MPLSADRVVEQTNLLKGYHDAERKGLNTVRRYLKGMQRLPAVIPSSSPREVRVMAASSRVNMIRRIVDSLVQSTRVEGFRAKNDADDLAMWNVWQANGMDARQEGVHRSTFAYGTAYAVVLPGDPLPVIRGCSPRNMTAVYGEDPDWPLWALERLGRGLWRLYDDEASYYVSERAYGGFEYVSTEEHGQGVTPVVRFLDEDDLDADDEVEPEGQRLDSRESVTRGQVAPLMPLQDQVDLTTFGLQIAQHYGAFRQRYILGWMADSEKQLMEVGAAKLMTLEGEVEGENAIKVGEFGQTSTDSFIKGRESTIRHMAVMSQTPLHELSPDQANPTSAEALAALEAGHDRKVDGHKALLGESHERMMRLVGRMVGVDVPDDAEVRWADTSATAFAARVDALGKMSALLNIPPQELWPWVPGATRQDVERWKVAAAEGDAFSQLTDLLDRQAAPPNGNGNPQPSPFG